MWAQGAKVLSRRLELACPEPAAPDVHAALLTALLRMSKEAELIAWRGSGGLL